MSPNFQFYLGMGWIKAPRLDSPEQQRQMSCYRAAWAQLGRERGSLTATRAVLHALHAAPWVWAAALAVDAELWRMGLALLLAAGHIFSIFCRGGLFWGLERWEANLYAQREALSEEIERFLFPRPEPEAGAAPIHTNDQALPQPPDGNGGAERKV